MVQTHGALPALTHSPTMKVHLLPLDLAASALSETTMAVQMAVVVHFDQMSDELPLPVVRIAGLLVVELLAERADVTLGARHGFSSRHVGRLVSLNDRERI